MSLPSVAASRRSYTVAGQTVTFESDQEWLAEKSERLVAGWHFGTRVDDPADAFTIRLSSEAAPATLQGPSAFEIHRGHCYPDGDSYSINTSDSWMRVRPLSMRLVEVWVGAQTARSSTEFARVMFYSTQAALRQCGLFELHTAAVIAPDRQHGVLVIGASGSGKSTLAMRLTAAGWFHVADDLVLIREDSPDSEAFAFRRVFAVTDTTLEACPPARIGEATREPSDFEPFKRRLDPEVLYPGRFAPSCTPRTLVFSRITGEDQTEARPMGAPEALTRLLKMCPWASYDTLVSRPHLSALASLARQCASYELRAGTDLLRDGEAAPRLFASLAAGAP